MVKTLTINRQISPNSNLPRIGGDSFLPLEFDWPSNSNGDKLTLIFSLPSLFLNKHCGLNLAENEYISVFSTYNNDYFLDDVIDNGDISDSKEIYQNFTRVIRHPIGCCRNESINKLDSFLIEAKEYNPNDIYTRIGGAPVFLQSPVSDVAFMRFCFQLNCEILPKKISNILYLEDAVGYLFINANNKDIFGCYFGQCL
ncbi:hypothetical protein F3B47_24090 [Bacteroides fragilis]|uniref:Uncharacterized protein n=3 Tax=Bacteroidaceae TaxID=815 RepID=A0A6I1APC4_PHOVU|nr:hypothetical protein [Bacteroides uniformis]KAA4737643.1 hypothetical protein F3B44_27075 [Bacteroides fragilis]KAB6587024.1 hypothetical protein GAZ81_22690 [Phocaeicola vulgatus]KAA4737762.1 hypothetical protein F3B36_23050 [Bacteroides fragilis]KAA4751239.1 hypothetical protein F3B47_24090 [Bacteroides fragilis]KAA4756044.1 hypothetical protein F3B24_23020 [Bacteroides fragilis]